MCHRIFWLPRLIQRRHLVTDRFFNFKLFAFWKHGQLNAGEFLAQITLWLTLGLPSPPLSPTPCVLAAPAWAHTGMPCWRAARDLSCQEEERRGALQRPPQPFFCSRCWNRCGKKKKIPLVMLRHVIVKCFVKLRDFLILGMPKQVQRKLAIFKNWLKRFSCSASDWCLSVKGVTRISKLQGTHPGYRRKGKVVRKGTSQVPALQLGWRNSRSSSLKGEQRHKLLLSSAPQKWRHPQSIFKRLHLRSCSPLSSVPSEKSPSTANSGKALQFRMWGISLYLNSLLHELWFRPPACLSLCVEMNGAMQIFTGSGSVLLYVC